ncbi:MAG: M28 family peptidase [Candidatus Thermoplasmatota archaeon]|nr:M28 family peptidase [Candidatus Thermoplasmatota archaeon]
MRNTYAWIACAALLLSAIFGGCIASNESAGDDKGLPAYGENESAAVPAYYNFDFSKYNSTLPSGENMFNELTIISNAMGTRLVATPQNTAAALYMQENLKSYGLETQLQEFTEMGAVPCKNVLGFKWGTNRSDWIVFGAHYDTSATVQGAYDNAGGCVAVLELANALSKYNFTKTLVFALWDFEELGLYGSQYFVEQFKANHTFTNFNYDCYGLNYPTSNPLTGQALKHWVGIQKKSDKTGRIENFNSILKYVANKTMGIPADMQDFHPFGSGSDHEPFAAVKSPIAYFDSDPDSAEQLCIYNDPRDEFLTYVVAAGGPEELKKGLESPAVFAYYSAILWSEFGN